MGVKGQRLFTLSRGSASSSMHDVPESSTYEALKQCQYLDLTSSYAWASGAVTQGVVGVCKVPQLMVTPSWVGEPLTNSCWTRCL